MRRISLAIIGSAALVAALTAAPAHAAAGPEQTRISEHLSAGRISIGQSATISGLLEGNGPSGWQPLANQPVLVYLADSGQQSPVQVTTDTQGNYSYKITAAPGSLGKAWITAYFNIQGNPDPAYTRSNSPTLPLKLPVTRSFSGGQISSSPFGQITLAGSFHPALKPGAPVSIEYSPNGTDHWKQMAVAHADRDGYFRGTAYSLHSGYWRPFYKGDANNYPIVAYTYKNWRWNTHFTSFKASRSGAMVKAGGTLVRYFPDHHQGAFANATVDIIFRFKGKKNWYLLGTAKTNTHGQFSTKVKRYGAGSYAALFEGTDDTWASGSRNSIYVQAVPADRAATMDSPMPTGFPVPAQHTQYLR